MENYSNDATVSLVAVFIIRAAPRRGRVKQNARVMRLETHFFLQGILNVRHLFIDFDFILILP